MFKFQKWIQQCKYTWVMHSFSVLLTSRHNSTQLLLDECSSCDMFHKEKTEAPVEMTIYIITNLLLDYTQYYVQYLQIVQV